MKKRMWAITLLIALVIIPTKKSQAVWWVVVKAAIKKAILAADLAIQKQQNKVIWLQNAQKEVENVMSKLKLEEISNWTEKQRKLYKDYFDELHKVKTIITYYKRIKEIARKQIEIVEEYKRFWRLIRQDNHFTPDEIIYMGTVYQGIIDNTLKNVDQITLIVTSFVTTMSDAKRLQIINEAADSVDETYTDLKQFNNENYMLSLSRAKSLLDIDQIKLLYGFK